MNNTNLENDLERTEGANPESINMERSVPDNIDNEIFNKTNKNINIYRYKFTPEFMSELYQFSKIHQYDDRHSFKDAWNIWVQTNETFV